MLDLAQLSKYKENNRIEAKKAQGGLPHSIWETYSAFANTFGGYILLGVVENADKSFSSVPLPSPEKLVSDFWENVMIQKGLPPLAAFLYTKNKTLSGQGLSAIGQWGRQTCRAPAYCAALYRQGTKSNPR